MDADCKNDKTSNIKLDLVGESPFHLKGSFPGPEGTPYEGGHFEVVSLLIIYDLMPQSVIDLCDRTLSSPIHIHFSQ